MNILIAEDNKINYQLLGIIINRIGIRHIWAKNGIEAIDLLAKHENISLILMDINMPEMDGITAAKIIREHENNVPIIFQTAYTTEENQKECFKAGGNEFLSKPLNINILNNVLKKYLATDKINIPSSSF